MSSSRKKAKSGKDQAEVASSVTMEELPKAFLMNLKQSLALLQEDACRLIYKPKSVKNILEMIQMLRPELKSEIQQDSSLDIFYGLKVCCTEFWRLIFCTFYFPF